MQAGVSEASMIPAQAKGDESAKHHRFGFGHHHAFAEPSDGSPRRTKLAPRRRMSLGNEKEVRDWHAFPPSPRSPFNRETRRTSTPLQSHDRHEQLFSLSSPRRASGSGGAKPVAPSWHPDAPEGLKVPSPPDAVLLPELPLAGMASNKEPVQILEDRIASSSIAPARLETEKVIRSETVKLQRPAIKVRIVTWNQGNSVPKGDLGVLLGRVGEYIAPEAGWDESDVEEENAAEQKSAETGRPSRKHRGMGVAGQEGIPRKDRIPPLPHDDAHPYHVVIVAGQECPWGDGKRIATSVGMANELGALSRSMSRAAAVRKDGRAKERGKEKDPRKNGENGGDQTINDDMEAISGEHAMAEGARTPGVVVTHEEDPFTAALPLTPGGVVKARGGGRGWSEMCEDWLCRGPLAQATATKGLAIASSAVSNPPSGLQSPQGGASPALTRSPSPLPSGLDDEMTKITLSHAGDSSDGGAATPTKRVSLVVPKRVLHRISRSRANSSEGVKLSHSPSLTSTNGLLTTEGLSSMPSSSPPTRPVSPLRHSYSSTGVLQRERRPDEADREEEENDGKKAQHHRLAIRIPGLSGTHHVTVESDGTPSSIGAYELVSKERCYMMYMAVYVWRGCLDRVRGCSQGHVKSGLLSGRVGNKGAVGISLKLGQSRLLFVNAHLAAHEGKVAERIANVEKIKKELKVDNFLPKDDPRNSEDDVTSCFDYAFWFGDLNFRVDITRKHADWLMMKKQYEHALAFDQLRTLMREQPEVFSSFKEAPITFPPTFKYDVLKTIKQKRQNDERRLKHSEALIKGQLDEGDQSANLFLADTSMVRTEGEDDRSSISSAVNISSLGHTSELEESTSPTSPDSAPSPTFAQDDVVAINTAAAEKVGLHGKAIKMRKRFFNAVHSAVDAVAQTLDDGQHSNQIDQTAGAGREKVVPVGVDRPAGDGHVKAVPIDVAISPSHSYQPFSALSGGSSADSHMAGKSLRGSSSAGQLGGSRRPENVGGDSVGEDEDDDINQVTQLYDTSAKQRVPSWCDRVLWRSNVKVLEDETSLGVAASGDAGVGISTPPSRISVKLSNAISRLHAKIDGTDSGPTSRSALRQAPGEGVEGDKEQLARPRWYSKRTPSLDTGDKKLPRHKTMTGDERSAAGTSQRLASVTQPPLQDSTPGVLNRSGSANAALFGSSDLEAAADLSSSSQSAAVPPLPSPEARRTSFNLDWSRLRSMNPTPSPLSGKDVDPLQKLDTSASRQRDATRRTSAHPSGKSSRNLPRSSTMQPSSPTSDPPRRTSRWADLLSHLSPLLSQSNSVANAFANLRSGGVAGAQPASTEEEVQEALIGPRRGQVECMLYKSLNDREMRVLEGRSDHRPVVFVGSIGMGRAKDEVVG